MNPTEARAIKATLAERGYPDAVVSTHRGISKVLGPPPKVVHGVFFTLGLTAKCWPCWSAAPAIKVSCTPGSHVEGCEIYTNEPSGENL